jgi:hypothetical protein
LEEAGGVGYSQAIRDAELRRLAFNPNFEVLEDQMTARRKMADSTPGNSKGYNYRYAGPASLSTESRFEVREEDVGDYRSVDLPLRRFF